MHHLQEICMNLPALWYHTDRCRAQHCIRPDKRKKKFKSSTSRNPPGEIKETMESICYAHLFEKQQQRGGEMGWRLFWYIAFNTTSSVGEPQFKCYGSTFSLALERTLLQRETLGEIVSSERTWAAKTVNSSPSFTSPTACPNAKHTSC